MKKKVVLIGIDSILPSFVERFVQEEKLPHIKKLIEEGTFMKALPSLPTLTSTNWTTIATGAEPIVHGVSDYSAHYPGEPLNKFHSGFSSRYCQAEQIWITAAKAGLKSILIDYPLSLPLKIKENIIHVGEWGEPSKSLFELSEQGCFCNYSLPSARIIKVKRAEGWKGNIHSHRPPLEAELLLNTRRRKIVLEEDDLEIMEEIKKDKKLSHIYHMLILDPTGEGYNEVIITKEKLLNTQIARLKIGEWSPWIYEKFTIEGEKIKGVFRFKLLELDREGRRVKLYISQIYPTTGFTYPPELSEELIENIGPYQSHSFEMTPVREGQMDFQTYMEESAYQANWYGQTAAYLMEKEDWSLLLLKWHGPDHFKHLYWGEIDPATVNYDTSRAKEGWRKMALEYQLCDELVAHILKAVDKNTLVFLVSDHGQIGYRDTVWINTQLARKGLLRFKKGGGIEWAETKAFACGFIYVYVNLKNRDPQGIVEPGEEYEKVRDEVINALLDIKDPETGARPILFALRREDAIPLGVGGERAGDIVYCMNVGYVNSAIEKMTRRVVEKETPFVDAPWGLSSGIHGNHHSTAKYSIGALEAVVIASGPGIKTGYRKKQFIHLKDIAPTISYILGISPPRDSQGSILRDIFK